MGLLAVYAMLSSADVAHNACEQSAAFKLGSNAEDGRPTISSDVLWGMYGDSIDGRYGHSSQRP